MKLSIITTLYFSAIHIKEFYERSSKVAQELVGEKYELIMVDDGSPDESLMTAVALTKEDHHLKILELSKNYGHHKALMTGLMHAKGDLVFLIDSDLEEEPEWLIPFAIEMQKKKCDVVYGVQENRKGGYLEKLSGKIFYKIFRLLTGVNQPDNIVTARLMLQSYKKALCEYEEREMNIGGIFLDAGFNQKIFKCKKTT